MAGITLAEAEAQLATWMAASTAVASGQRYRIDTGNGSRELERADLADIQQSILFWDGRVKALSAMATRRSRTRYVVPG